MEISQLDKLILLFSEKKNGNLLLLKSEFSHKEIIRSLFNLIQLFPKNKVVPFWEYFQTDCNNKYDLIIAELPFGLAPLKKENSKGLIPGNWSMISELLNNLNDDGMLLVGVESSLTTSTKGKTFLSLLKDGNIFLNALIEMPRNILAPLTSLQPSIAVFSKKDNKNNLFIASLDENDDSSILFQNFLDKRKGADLIVGDIIDIDKFKGFHNYRVSKEIENLQTQYKEFQEKPFNEIILSINSTKTIFQEGDGEYLYIPQLGSLNVYRDLTQLDKKHQNYYQICLNKEVANAKYLEKYFKSDVGQLSLKALLANTFIPRVNKSELETLIIPIPPVEIQKEIISSYTLLDNVFSVISKLEKDLSLNPKNAKKIIEKLTDTLKTLNELSNADRVLSYIRQGESVNIEYKQTFSMDIKTKTKAPYIEDASLKNIVGFLNKEGGSLLVGVTDSREIYGIENDNFQSDDKYLLHFKNRFKEAIGEDLFEFVNYMIVNVNDKKILLVECKPSDRAVFLYKNDFYVRTNPATDKLEGPKMVDYINSHFKKQ